MPPTIAALLERTSPKRDIFYVGFGSMEELGVVAAHAGEIASAVCYVVQRRGWVAVVQCLDRGPLFQAFLDAPSPKDLIVCVSCTLPHDHLFAACRAALHHGGAGTVMCRHCLLLTVQVASCLRAACPQIICPFMFDQVCPASALCHVPPPGCLSSQPRTMCPRPAACLLTLHVMTPCRVPPPGCLSPQPIVVCPRCILLLSRSL